jgi:hypothetical protein
VHIPLVVNEADSSVCLVVTNTEPPKVTYRPMPSSSTNFVGREDYLSKLEAVFVEGRNQTGSRPISVLSALGGMGKTQISVRFAETRAHLRVIHPAPELRHLQKNLFSFSKIYWVDGTSQETMEASIVSIASDEDAKSAGVDASLPSVLHWMGRRDDNWLIIFDGADVGYGTVEGFMPPGKHGNILISSRDATMNRLVSPPSAHMDVVELDKIAAIELFTRSALLGDVSPVQRAHVQAIVQELCCLALAIDQAASSIATGICHIDEYLTLYNRRRRELMDDEFFNGSSNYGRAVYTTWDISLAELERRASSSPSDSASYKAAIFLLQIFSFFHFDGIHEEIFVVPLRRLVGILILFDLTAHFSSSSNRRKTKSGIHLPFVQVSVSCPNSLS